MEKINAWIFIIIGIVLVLPLLSLTFLGVAGDWIVALGLLIIGILKVSNKK